MKTRSFPLILLLFTEAKQSTSVCFKYVWLQTDNLWFPWKRTCPRTTVPNITHLLLGTEPIHCEITNRKRWMQNGIGRWKRYVDHFHIPYREFLSVHEIAYVSASDVKSLRATAEDCFYFMKKIGGAFQLLLEITALYMQQLFKHIWWVYLKLFNPCIEII